MAVIKIVPMPGAEGQQGDTGATGAQGPQGPQGLQGPAGADAAWYYNGAYNPGASYVVGDVVTYEGQTWYRKNANGGNVGDTPSEGLFWDLIAAKGEQGEPGDLDTGTTTINSYSPIWAGTGLSFTGTPTFGEYVKIGNLVQVQIDVEFDNVTDFGTGQYSLTLPFASKYHTDVYGGSVHKVNSEISHYSLKGHLSPSNNVMTVWAVGSNAVDQEFDHNSPVNLTVVDKFHMAFSYICE